MPALQRHQRRATIGRARALLRYLRDPAASIAGKLFLVVAVAYVAWPADLIPDVPIVGWLDDLGVVGIAAAYVARKVAPYRLSSPS